MAKPKGKIKNMLPKASFGPSKAAPKATAKDAPKPGKYDGDQKMGKYC